MGGRMRNCVGRARVRVSILRGCARARISPPLPLGEGGGEGSPDAWTCPAALTLTLSRRERAPAHRRRREKVTRTRQDYRVRAASYERGSSVVPCLAATLGIFHTLLVGTSSVGWRHPLLRGYGQVGGSPPGNASDESASMLQWQPIGQRGTSASKVVMYRRELWLSGMTF